MLRWARRLLRDTRAASAVEYGLIISLVVLAIVIGLTALAGTTINMWNDVSNKVGNAR